MLVEKLQTGTLLAETVVSAFCKRSAVAQQAFNCATELLYNEALAAARACDEHLRATGKPLGPLHGLPVSVKDTFDVRGHLNTAGLVSRLGEISSDDCLVVSLLRAAGAIPFIKTNVSQGCLLVESINNIYGTVLNPWNRSLSAGGSSGGEGSLVGFRGSPLGLGTDGGGSLRLPAAWNGVYTLKPSSARLPGAGRGSGYSDSNTGCYGPLANDVATLRLYCSAILASEPWLRDPGIVPMPWNDRVKAPARLRLGVLRDDGIIHACPPVLRCLDEASARLREAGYEIIDLNATDSESAIWQDLHRRGTSIIFRIYTQEGGIGIREQLEASGEPLIPRVCTGWSETPLEPKEIWLNHRARKALRLQYLAAMQARRLDAIITAPMPHPAPPHGHYITTAISAIYNLLDYPCAIVPYGRVDLAKDVASRDWYAQKPYDPIPDFPYDRYDKEMKELCTFCPTPPFLTGSVFSFFFFFLFISFVFFLVFLLFLSPFSSIVEYLSTYKQILDPKSLKTLRLDYKSPHGRTRRSSV